ncbi:Lsr2 family protein [Streptomyces sp. SID5770]|nr:Lsr2 family protein [Streptomyces sp. SID5770]MZE54297.1 Lsr2 family protein [Streptomyces sp. SID5770]
MAQKIVTIYTDDLTGSESEEAAPHTFALDGVGYEIDLAPESYDKLLDALGPFIKQGRRTGRIKGQSSPRSRKAPSGGPSAEEIRSWAKERGLEVNERGRVPSGIREQYEAAH